MRIVGGRMRGLGLTPVGKGDPAAHLRPTSDRVRESLFNLLEGGRFGAPVPGARVLDLFAGTGAVGLEALSRGAKAVTFVETGRPALKILRGNIAKARAEAETKVLVRDATRLGACEGPPATLVFLDPPYGKGLVPRVLESALSGAWFAPDALVVVEEREEVAAPEGFARLEARRYGDTWLTFMTRAPDGRVSGSLAHGAPH